VNMSSRTTPVVLVADDEPSMLTLVSRHVRTLGYDVLEGPKSLERLVRVSRFVDEMANLTPHVHQPYVGPAAFTHKGGMHVHAVLKNVSTYEHVPPESVGNNRHMVISELSGTSNVQDKITKMLGTRGSDRALLKRILDRVMDLENEGYVFEQAEASFELIVRQHLGIYRAPFEIVRYDVGSGGKIDNGGATRATVEVRVDGDAATGKAEGTGPIHTYLAALIDALGSTHPFLSGVSLIDFKAHFIHMRGEKGRRVRVTTQFQDDATKWGTVAVSSDLDRAIWQCIVEGTEYAILRRQGTIEEVVAKAETKGGPAAP